MTHEYVIALGGKIEPGESDQNGIRPTAIAWAADHVLAVGRDDVVRSISRGDSTFLDLGGRVVTALPADPARAEALVREQALLKTPDLDIAALLIEAELLDEDSALGPGSPAELAFWDTGGGLVAVVRSGAFTEGDEHRGPFPAASPK